MAYAVKEVFRDRVSKIGSCPQEAVGSSEVEAFWRWRVMVVLVESGLISQMDFLKDLKISVFYNFCG